MGNFKNDSEKLMFKFGLVKRVMCSGEESKRFSEMLSRSEKLPDDVFSSDMETTHAYYRLSKPFASEQEINLYLNLLQTSHLTTIRNCAVYFAVISALSIFGGIVYLFVRFS